MSAGFFIRFMHIEKPADTERVEEDGFSPHNCASTAGNP